MQIELKKIEKYIDIYDIFRILKKENNKKIAFLDSSLKNKYGRYSIIGIDPYLELKENDNKFYINNVLSEENFEEYLAKFLKENKQENNSILPLISGGIVYFSYDYGRNYNNLINILEKTNLEKENLVKKNSLANFKSNFEKEEYLKAIKSTIDYIIEGDIYIMNLTQRLMIESQKSPLEVFSYLRKFNPAPFSAYLDFQDFQFVSASPERFIKMKDGLIETRPIKGTRKRGATEEEDLALKNELANSEKDKSELLMIVDLERNDLNRICELKSVVVDELFEVETYSTVFHLVSTIRGKLRKNYDFVDLIRATFPGGSITGAPKIRAMEIIDELENSRRDAYFNGDCDLNIVIRTAIHKDNKYYLGVGGGITCESELDFEYEETLQKAKAILEALC